MKAIGNNQMIALRILQAGDRRQADLVRAMSGPMAPASAEAIVNGLMAKGLVSIAYGRLRLTRAGHRALPADTPTWDRTEYTPERVIRRAGSERASRLPSVAAGIRYYPGADDQRGFMNMDFTGFFLALIVVVAFVGAVAAIGLPALWDLIKPWIHEVTK